ncbi:MAG: methyltransferase domain-containing protein [Vicingus serpentipes]|nr:methyltransferase domain-containing protein [Vicingus serpentipes]
MEKHYDSSYLKDSSKFTQQIKEYSYGFFKEVSEGIVLDLGCGPGIDVNNMSMILNNKVSIHGLDHDINMIAVAKKDIVKPNVNFIHSEAETLPFKTNSINGIRVERVIQHLKNPFIVINEIHRVLVKGAPLVIIETDWNNITFYTQHTTIERKIQKYLVEEKVYNGLASRKIISYLKNQEFDNIDTKLFSIITNSLKEANDLFKIKEILYEMNAKGLLSNNDVDIFDKDIHELDKVNCFFCSINLVVFSTQK